ncbi:penicillin-binding protein 2 [Candidatus Fermentibacteria bacterium]|nr:MAG: penicillin-binding protein 2 [Candidatus Fermentibacteria bacterium]
MTTGNTRNAPPFISLLVFSSICFLVLTFRLFSLQILNGEYYREMSSRNHIRSVVSQAARGVITDRNGIILADNYPSFTVSLVSVDFSRDKSALLAELLNMDHSDFEDRLVAAESNPYRNTIIATNLDIREAGRVADNLYRLGGVSVEVAPRRRYPFGEEFCHLVGYVGLSDSIGVFHGEITGRTGLERILNEHLAGKHGVVNEVVDAYGRVVERFDDQAVAPVPGEETVLTVDSRLQLMADSLIEASGHPGAAVVLDWSTGEILCLASVPGFDLNLFVEGISSDDWNEILEDPDRPLINRSWGTSYPPGSTYKTVSSCWLLESGLTSSAYMPDPCYGTFNYAGTDFRCWSAHGRLNIIEALAVSCDTYFYRTSMEGDIDKLAEVAEGFGMGGTVTEFLPAESPGVIPTREYLNGLFGQGGWGTGNLMIASIGQGEVLATPLQVAVTSGLIASRFQMPKLSILYGENNTAPEREKIISDEVLDIVSEGMLQAVESRRGTLSSSMGDLPVTVYAKSGTAENSSGEDHAWVTGYICEPAAVAFAVIVENGGHGGQTAGPVAAELIRMIAEEYSETL